MRPGEGPAVEHVVKLDGPVTDFHISGQHIHCMCGKQLLKADKDQGEIFYRKEVFAKRGFSRKLAAEGGEIFVYDFCTLSVFRQEDYALQKSWKLGNDLSSDICGMAVDENTVYCSIRNGKLVALDWRSGAEKEFPVLGSSMWSLVRYGEGLVCGSVDGKLLLLDKKTMSIEKRMDLGRKNIGSLYRDGETLYAASHDGRLFRINMRSWEIEALVKNAHKKMFGCVGMYQDMLVTVSHPCSEVALWDKNTLEKRGMLTVPLQLSGRARIEGGFLYLSSRNIMGIDKIRLSQ